MVSELSSSLVTEMKTRGLELTWLPGVMRGIRNRGHDSRGQTEWRLGP